MAIKAIENGLVVTGDGAQLFNFEKDKIKTHAKESINLCLEACMISGLDLDEIVDEIIKEGVSNE